VKNKFVSIAGFTIRLVLHDTEYEQAKKLFLLQLLKVYKGFIVVLEKEKKIDFTIHIIQNNQTEVLKYKESNYIEYYKVGKDKNSISTFYSVSIEQFAQLLRYILFHLIQKSGFFMHGAVGIQNNRALLFIGPSGVGKSTIIRMTKKTILPFADDSFIIRQVGDKYLCFQTPFLDKQTWIKKKSEGYPITKVYLLEQSKDTSIEKTNSREAKDTIFVELISNNAMIKQNSQLLLRFLDQFNEIYKFQFSLNSREVSKALSFATREFMTATVL